MNWKSKFPNKRENKSPLVLVQGKDMSGNPQWAFALIDPEKFLDFKVAEANGNYQLTDFGKVVAHGHGKNPPQDVIDEMIEKYDADMDFENKLLNKFQNEVEGFTKLIKQLVEKTNESSNN